MHSASESRVLPFLAGRFRPLSQRLWRIASCQHCRPPYWVLPPCTHFFRASERVQLWLLFLWSIRCLLTWNPALAQYCTECRSPECDAPWYGRRKSSRPSLHWIWREGLCVYWQRERREEGCRHRAETGPVRPHSEATGEHGTADTAALVANSVRFTPRYGVLSSQPKLRRTTSFWKPTRSSNL